VNLTVIAEICSDFSHFCYKFLTAPNYTLVHPSYCSCYAPAPMQVKFTTCVNPCVKFGLQPANNNNEILC